MHNLDETDKKILEMLSTNARTPLKELSAAVFLTTPAVSARIEKLEKEGYIRGYHADLDLEMLGYGVKAYIMVSVAPEENQKFYDFARGQENIIECCHITGPYSMILKTAFESTSLLDEFLGRLQSFGKTETQVVFSTVIEKK